MLKRRNCTFKIINFKKEDYKAHSKKFRLTFDDIEEFLKILAHISFQTNKVFLL